MLATAARQLVSLGGVAVLARLLDPKAYGLMGMAATITVFLINFRDLGTTAAVVQRKELNQRLLSSLFWLNMGFGLLLTVLVAGLSAPAAAFFHDDQVGPILRAISFSFVLASAGMIHQALLTRDMSFHHVAMADFAASLAGYAVAIACALRGWGVWSLVASNLTIPLVSTVLYWVFCAWRPSLVVDRTEIGQVFGFSANLTGFGMVNFFSRNADNIIIGRVLGAQPLGLYQMAYNLMLYPLQNVSSVIAQVLFPAFARIQDDNERFRSAYVRSCLLIGLLTFPLIAGLGSIADPLLGTALGEKWIPAVTTFQILAPVGLVQSIFTTMGQIFISKGRTDLLFRWGIFSCVVLVTALFIGVPYGIAGVAVSYVVAYLAIIAPSGFLLAFRLIELPLGQFLKPFLPQLLITAGMAFSAWGTLRVLGEWGVGNWPRLIAAITVGAVVYIGALLLFRPPVMRHLSQDVLAKASHPAARKLAAMLLSN